MYKFRDFIQENNLIWDRLSQNPNAIPLLEKHPDKINWYWLSENPNGISLLEKHLDKIIWERFEQLLKTFISVQAIKNTLTSD